MDVAAGEPALAARHHRGDHAVLDGHLGSEGLESLDMLHHRAGADLAAAGQGHLGHPHAGQQGADAEEAGPQAVDQFVGRGGRGDGIPVKDDRVTPPLHAHAEGGEDLPHRGDVGQGRNVAEAQLVLGEQAGGHQHQGRILGPADPQVPVQTPSTTDLQPAGGDGLDRHGGYGHGQESWYQFLGHLDNE